jgi:hypothetical protein
MTYTLIVLNIEPSSFVSSDEAEVAHENEMHPLEEECPMISEVAVATDHRIQSAPLENWV